MTSTGYASVPETTEQVAHAVIQAAFQVHKSLGPGLLESVYEKCLCHELSKEGISFQNQLELPIVYDGFQIDAGMRMDLLVEDSLVVELKAVERLLPIHKAQLLTYLKLSGKRLGLLLNFNVPLLKDGMQRVVL